MNFVFATNGEGDLDAIPQKFAFDFSFEQKIAAVAHNQQLRHRATITETTSPRSGVLGIGINKPALFFVFSAEIVSVEISTVYRFIHCL